MQVRLYFHLITSLLFIGVLSGCGKKQFINLDHYGDFENVDLTINIQGGPDSCRFGYWNFQELYGPIEFDTFLTLLDRNVQLKQKITLERPTPVALTVNGLQKEVFLIPDLNNNFRISADSQDLKITFESNDLQNINDYYQSKAGMGGDMYLREALTKYVTLTTQKEAQDSLQTFHLNLHQNLNNKSDLLSLPEWFMKYEEKVIDYFSFLTISSLPQIRKRVFGIQDSVDIKMNFNKSGLSTNDELGMTTRDYLSYLSKVLVDEIDSINVVDLEPVERMHFEYAKSPLITSHRIRDVFRAQLFYRMMRSSIHFPDSLITLVKRSISPEMHTYVDRIEKMYKQFNGAPAPPIVLKDVDDSLVSLKDFRGNLVLLDFWFVGCRFCHIELPYTKALMESFKDRNFKVLQICMKSGREIWKELKNDFVGVALYSNPLWDAKLANSYKISGYPRYVLVDEEGIILEGWCERPSEPGLKRRIEHYFQTKDQLTEGI